jgi:mono/diheme cytochrome c family protein
MAKLGLLALLSVAIGSFAVLAAAQEQAASSDNVPAVRGAAVPKKAKASSAPSSDPAVRASAVHSDETWMRVEGEKRFQTNCGRCHMAPHKFPPRTMATIVRHMRVRAMITDEDTKLILRYMTQ